MKEPDLFSIYLNCKECGKLFHRPTKRRIFCSQACAKRENGKKRQRIIDEYRANKIAAE